MPNTYTLIASQLLNTNTTTVVFSGIPNTYKDLVMRISTTTTYNGFLDMYMWANNDTSSLYSTQRLSVDGGSFTVNRATGGNGVISAAAGTNLNPADYNNVEIYLANYSNTSYFKTAKGNSTVGGGSASGTIQNIAWLYRSTSAISSLYFGLGAGQFATNGLFRLYGIKNT